MTSERECYVYIVLPGQTSFVTAARFRVVTRDNGEPVGSFVYGRRCLERPDAVERDPVELRLAYRVYETGRMQGFFGAIRDAMPDYWATMRRVGVSDADCAVIASAFNYDGLTYAPAEARHGPGA